MPPASSMRGRYHEGRLELLRIGHRRLAGEVLADVGGGPALDRGTLAHQLGPLAALRPARQHHVRTVGGSDHRGEVRERGGGVGPVGRRHQGDLAHRGEVEVERLEVVAEGVGVLDRRPREQAEDADGSLLVGALAGERRQPEQPERGGGVAGGDRVVAEVLAAGDQLLVVVRGGEEAAALGRRRSARSSPRRSRGRRRTSAPRASPRTGAACASTRKAWSSR